MSVMARNNTPAAREARRPRRAPVYTQAELRQRRRTGLLHTYGGRWSLTAEVAAICDPLGPARHRPRRTRRATGGRFDDVALAVWELHLGTEIPCKNACIHACVLTWKITCRHAYMQVDRL